MKQNKLIYRLVFIFMLLICGWSVLNQNSYAQSPLIEGFIIEASQMEGTMNSISLTTGDTDIAKNQPMLDMKFADASVQGLVIKKWVQSPNGIVMTNITSKDIVLFKNLELKVTNAAFGGVYVPGKGKIGFKNVKLLAQNVTTDRSILPKFSLQFSSGGQPDMQPLSKDGLLQMKTKLEQLLFH